MYIIRVYAFLNFFRYTRGGGGYNTNLYKYFECFIENFNVFQKKGLYFHELIFFSRTGIAPNRSEVCNDLLSALGSGDDLEIEDAHYISSEFPEEMNFSLRGMEVNHVILCFIPELYALPKEKRVALNEKIDLYLSECKRVRMGKWRQEAHSFHRIFNNFDHWQMRKTHDLIEAISRAVTSVTIVYMEDICEDLWFNQIIERFKDASPKIRPNYANRNSKQQIENIEPLYLSKVQQLLLQWFMVQL